MTAGAGARAPAWFRYLPAAFLTLLAVPFQVFWLDFELVRRGVLLVLCGVVLALALRQRAWLPPPYAVPGARWLALFLAWMLVAALGNAGSLSIWDAAFRIAHFAAFFALLRLGAAFTPADWLRPLCWIVIGTSLFGLLQRLGIAAWRGYGTAADPVSVFGNLNVASEFTAVAAAAVAAATASGKFTARLGYPALALAGVYLAVNGSRSGLIAAPLALLPILYLARDDLRRASLPALALLFAIGIGFLIDKVATDPGALRTPAAAGTIVINSRQDTLAVRREIWHSCLGMAWDAPLFGAGPGQFQVQYPRFRSQREIELSSEGREFHAEAGTAHNDWLEILTEGGAPGLVLWLLFCFHLVRSVRQSPLALAPLCALGALMFVRAPLGNAPTVAVALLLCTAGSAAAMPPKARRRRYWQAADLGCVLVFVLLGIQPVLGNFCFTGYLRPKAFGLPVDTRPLEHATAVAPFIPAFWQALALERHYAAKDATASAEALVAAERALALRPHEPSFLLMRADILRQLGRLPLARLDLEAAAALDPGDPLWRVQRSGLEFMAGNHEAAIAVVWLDPHPRLKEMLPEHFARLEAMLKEKKDPAARRYGAEAAFAKALLSRDQGDMARTQELTKATLNAFLDAERLLYKDARPWLLIALQALDVEAREAAEQVARQIRTSKIEVHAWERALIGEQALDRLRAVPGWVDLLK